MLIDLHAHTGGISKCCRIPADKVVQAAKDVGLDGIVLTNHYQKDYAPDGDYAAFAARYTQEYHLTRAYGDALGLRVFFGIEVTMARYGGVHLLIYGVEDDFAIRHPALFDLTQKELYDLVKENGGTLIQAHPYRQGVDRMLDLSLLDGIEINCHPLYEGTHLQALADIAAQNALLLSCGGDYHADTRRPHCGVYLPDDVQSSKDICTYLAAAEQITLCVQEVEDTFSHDYVYHRT